MSDPLLTAPSAVRRATPALALLVCAAFAAITAIDLAVKTALPAAPARLHAVRAPADSSDAASTAVVPPHTVALATP